ncbi:ATP-binding protein [Paenibacillus ottowii]|uniref:ATP-binding protein n=1 Tax=Paenibacillus ottowii TaxID=2315729 RepID=UPI00273107A5|nr:ATP-binding protein [Paenibacillus ottowii]MDP1511872.1 ATP-binding protein [Paenibacillus ottowii]
MTVKHPIRGRVEVAEYRDTGIPDYNGHPLIEALPCIMEDADVIRKIKNIKKFNPEERMMSPSKRRHCIERLRSFVIPLSHHIELQQDFSEMIRQGYLSRNINTTDYIRRLRSLMLGFKDPEIAELEKEHLFVPAPTSSGLAIIGISGAGKTTAINRILSLYPQVIMHPKYEEKQLVWLKVDCPVTGTVKQLCLGVIKEVGELFGDMNYELYSRYRTDQLIPVLASMAMRYHLGVLVIDEIQYLSEAKSGGATLMLNFFNSLINMIGIPVILIGTPKAKSLFSQEFRNIKRVTNQGSIYWDRLKKEDSDWILFLSQLWKHQWTQHEVEMTQELNNVMYEESQGIPDLIVKIFIESQKRAIETEERLTSSLIHSVAQNQFKILQPALDALRSGKKEEMLRFLDIFLSDSPKEILTNVDRTELKRNFGLDVDQLLDENQQEDEMNEIVIWLMDAGVTEEAARKAAGKHKTEDKTLWKRLAFQEAHSAIVDVAEAIPSSSNRKKTEKNRKLNGLITHINKETVKKKNKQTNYAILKAAGYIQDPFKFLQLE